MKKKKKGRNPRQLFLRCLAIMITFYVFFTLYEQQKEMRYLKHQQDMYLSKIEQAQKEVDRLKEQLENSNTDEYIEKHAREQLKMIKKDEIIFIDLGRTD